ncbi:unnamed protein product [Nyctereutes procyonoides]|uniref:(raccoon dog) hypothetical protein n=1 Tax=Nyctereutes procyonoides TaxID=34880 RepID=A0A811YTH3_NYCPR|nr:unnamed protein product [Nyctereutes procyonoides]
MDCSWRILFLLALATGVYSEVQLVQSGAEVKKPGTSVKVSCKTSGYTFTDYYMYWVRQASGAGLDGWDRLIPKMVPQGLGLDWMGRIDPKDGATRYAQKFQGRVILRAWPPQAQSAQSAGVYYCAGHIVRTHILEVSEILVRGELWGGLRR